MRELFLMLQTAQFREHEHMFSFYQHPFAYGFTDRELGTIDFFLMVQTCEVAWKLHLDEPSKTTILYRAGIHTLGEFCRRLNIIDTKKGVKMFRKDVELVCAQTNCSSNKALVLLCDNDGDIVNAVMSYLDQIDAVRH